MPKSICFLFYSIDKHTTQLKEYFTNTSNLKIGILTNGIELEWVKYFRVKLG